MLSGCDSHLQIAFAASCEVTRTMNGRRLDYHLLQSLVGTDYIQNSIIISCLYSLESVIHLVNLFLLVIKLNIILVLLLPS